MTNEDLATFFIATTMPLFLFVVELSPWLSVALAGGSLIWVSRQIYMSFVNRKYIKAKDAREQEKRIEEKEKRTEEKEDRKERKACNLRAEAREDEKHALEMELLRKQLGKNDAPEPEDKS